ncbi:hypothetical protein BJ508DRAFT_215414 [Ascobolus immersus RN42]|uniref:General transcription factor TFIIB n=1 Tax=Ascobolus immersus RN42 TaxID=1160509 RepID=A0A3N4HPI7_ASCIM|nr:hypothetical protein BJ508DRAFT_215414 [Ascobolus immersus RN42]
MPVERRRRPGQSSRINPAGKSSWPVASPSCEPIQFEHHHIFFDGKSYKPGRVELRRGFEGWVAPKTDGPAQRHESNLNRIVICKDCRIVPANITMEEHDGDLVCGDCGLVLDKIVSTESEWRSFADDGVDKSRVGGGDNPLFGDAALELQTSIGQGGSNDMARTLERAQRNIAGKDGKKAVTQSGGFRDLATLCARGGFPDTIKDMAQQVYKLYMDEPRRKKSLSLEAILSACLVIGSRQAGVGRSFREIGRICKVSDKAVGKAFKIVGDVVKARDAYIQAAKAENIHVDNKMECYNANKNVTTARDLIVRMAELLRLKREARSLAEEIAAAEEKVGCLAGRKPSTVAACALLMAYAHLEIEKDSKKALEDVSRVAGISAGTLSKVYKLLAAEKEKLVSEKWNRV